MADKFLDYLKKGKAAQAATLIERALDIKIRTALIEERSAVAGEVYGDELNEGVKNPTQDQIDASYAKVVATHRAHAKAADTGYGERTRTPGDMKKKDDHIKALQIKHQKAAEAHKALVKKFAASMKEEELTEDKHGNTPTAMDMKHPSYKAGHAFGISLSNSKDPSWSNPMMHSDRTSHIHAASADHIRDLSKTSPMKLQDKLDSQRQFKMGAHNAYYKATGKGSVVKSLGEELTEWDNRPDAEKRSAYDGPMPRGKHSHRCTGCKKAFGQTNAVACYKKGCTAPKLTDSCSHCRSSMPSATHEAVDFYESGGVISESKAKFQPEKTDHPLAHELYHSALNDHEHAIKHGYPGGGNLNQWADNYRKKMAGTKKSDHTPTYDKDKAIHGLTHAIDRTREKSSRQAGYGEHSYKPSVSYETKHAAASKLLPHVMNLVHGRPHNEGIK